MATSFDKAIFTKTLLCLLQSLEGVKTTVELRNETFVTGIIMQVDSKMNLQMEQAVLSHRSDTVHANLFVKGTQIRYVHIPSEVNVAETLAHRMQLGRNLRTYDERRKSRRSRGSRSGPRNN